MTPRSAASATIALASVLLLVVALGALCQPTSLSEITASDPITFRIDPNVADADTLSLLPGIGPGIAQRIIDDRQANGPFRDVHDLQRVHMIGEKTVAAVTPWVRVDSAAK